MQHGPRHAKPGFFSQLAATTVVAAEPGTCYLGALRLHDSHVFCAERRQPSHPKQISHGPRLNATVAVQSSASQPNTASSYDLAGGRLICLAFLLKLPSLWMIRVGPDTTNNVM